MSWFVPEFSSMAAAVSPEVKVGSVVSTVIVNGEEGSEYAKTRRSSWKGSAKDTTPEESWLLTLLLSPP